MKAGCRLAWLGALCLSLALTGCSLFPTTRKLPVPRAPNIEQTISPEELVSRLNQRSGAITALTATVEMQASVTHSKEGLAKDYPSIHGNILLRKPSDLRVLGRYFGVPAFDMASNGDCFTLSIPHDNKVIKGCGPSKTKAANTLENLRPGFFFDAMLVRGLDADDLYSVVNESETIEDPARKHLYTVPEYVLSINRRKADSPQLLPVRVITIHRDDLLPYQQDIYDKDGNIETEVFYRAYQDFEGGRFPSSITIKRPIDEIQIVLTVDAVHENGHLGDEQFVVQIPEGAKVQKLE